MLSQLCKEVWAKVIAWLKKIWFEAKLKARLDMIELQNQIESEREREERFEPVYKEKPIDDELQTGDSRLLGGEMRLVAKWVDEAEKEMERSDSQGEV